MSCKLLTGLIFILIAGLHPNTLHARERTEVGTPRAGEVCFGYGPNQQCVKIMSGTRKLGEGPYAGASEWIIEIKSAEGRTISRVGAGGDIVVFSPHAFAKREPGQRTYTIERMDRRARPVRTNFVMIGTFLKRTGWAYWAGPQGAFGMSEIPPAQDPAHSLRGRIRTAGRVTGIARDGSLTETYDNVVSVQYYSDFNVLSFPVSSQVPVPLMPWEKSNPRHVPRMADVADHQVTDADFRPVSPKTNKIVAFLPTFIRQYMGRDAEFDFTADNPTPPIMYGVDRGTEVNGQRLYSLLPRFAGQAARSNFLGVVALDSWQRDFRGRPFGLTEHQTIPRIAAFAGIWATPNGPEMSFLRFNGEPFDDNRYRSITWTAILGGSGILEDQSGKARLILPVAEHWGPDFELSIDTFPSVQAAKDNSASALQKFSQNRQQIIRAKAASDRAEREYQEAERLRAIREEELRQASLLASFERAQRERQQLAELGTVEANRMRELVKMDASQWQTVCNEAYAMVTYYAQTHAVSHCNAIRPRQTYTPQKQDFWGQLASAIDGWASLSAANGARPPSSAPLPQGVSPDWDYARSARAIDNTVRTVTDPNWNGAAVRATQR
jgi:hypothetical protein